MARSYTISIVLFLYVVAILIDIMLGFSAFDLARSYLFRLAAAALILATYLHLMVRGKRLWPFPLVLASLTLSALAIAYGQTDPATLANAVLKILAAILTLKPESIELEISIEREGSAEETVSAERASGNDQRRFYLKVSSLRSS